MTEWTPPPNPEDLPKKYEAWGSGMKKIDYLLDRYFDFATLQMAYRIEQPRKECPCGGTGRLRSHSWAVSCGWISESEFDFHPFDECTATVPCPFCHEE